MNNFKKIISLLTLLYIIIVHGRWDVVDKQENPNLGYAVIEVMPRGFNGRDAHLMCDQEGYGYIYKSDLPLPLVTTPGCRANQPHWVPNYINGISIFSDCRQIEGTDDDYTVWCIGQRFCIVCKMFD